MTVETIKATVRSRDSHRCVDCGISQDEYGKKYRKRRRLEVHRLIPGSVYTIDGCVTLCRPCHRIRHRTRNPDAVRMIFDTTEEIRKAVGLRALKDGCDLQDVINEALREFLKREIEEVKHFRRP